MKALLVEQPSVHRPAGLMVLARIANIALGLVTVPVLLHFLGVEGFAAWAMLLAIGFAFSALELGLPPTYVKHAAPLMQAGQWRGVDGLLSTAWLILAGTYLVAGLPLAWLAPVAARLLHLPDTPLMPAASLVLAVFVAAGARSLLQFGAYTLLAARRFRALAAASFLQSFLANAAAIAAAAWTRRLDCTVLAYWSLQLLVVAAGFAFSRKLFAPDPGSAAPSVALARQLMPHGLRIQLSDWAQIVTFQFDKFLIASLVGLPSVAPYEVANRSILALRSVPSSALDSFLPSAAIGQGTPEETWRRYLAVTRLSAIAVMAFMLAPLAIAPAFLYAWTGEMGYLSRGVFVGLSLGFIANVLALPATAMVQAAGRTDIQARAAIATLLVNLPLSLLLLMQWGAVGAALGTSVAMLVGAALVVVQAHRAYGRPLRPTLAIVARFWPVVLVCIAFAAVTHLGFEQWFAGVPADARYAWRSRLVPALWSVVGYVACLGVMLLIQVRRGMLGAEQVAELRRWWHKGSARVEPKPLASDLEFELLLCCARLDLGEAQRRRIAALLAGTLDWSRLYVLAERHGLRPLLFRHLGDGRFGPIPNEFENRLWQHAEQLRRRNARMEGELLEVLDILRDAGIPALAHKGPVVSCRAYGEPALREFGDLDVLLPAASIPRARELLEQQGYRPKYPLTPALESTFIASRRQYHMMLSHRERSLVELHWRTDGDYAVERSQEPGWWERLPTVEVQGQAVACLPDEDFLLALCLHGSKHYWSVLRWLVDVAELLRPLPAERWLRLVARAHAVHAERRLALAFRLAHDHLDVPLPDPVEAWLGAVPGIGEFAAEVSTRWPRLDAPVQTAGDRLRLDFALCDRPSQRLRHLGRTILLPGIAEWSRWPLPEPLHFLYLPLRVGGLVRRRLSH